MTTVPKGVRGYYPPLAEEDQPQPAHVYTETLGPMVPLMSNSPDQWVAAKNMMLRVVVGSTVHGTSIEGTDDRDEMGVCVEPTGSVIGLNQFNHYTFRTQPEGECSGPGDLDLVVYGLRRYVSLACRGNPTVLLPLFVPEEHVCYATDFGHQMRERRSMFLSQQAAARFRGYLESQRQGLLGLRSGGTRNQGRADIRAKYGFDTKFAGHMVRLGVQGVELLTTGDVTLPIPEPDLTWIRELRTGQHTLQEALDRAEKLEAQIDDLMSSGRSVLPEQPDMHQIEAWMAEVYRSSWGW